MTPPTVESGQPLIYAVELPMDQMESHTIGCFKQLPWILDNSSKKTNGNIRVAPDLGSTVIQKENCDGYNTHIG